jgi:hypothetical protein
MFHRLDSARILETTQSLARRVGERFPESALRLVAEDLAAMCQATMAESDWFRRPQWLLRFGVALSVILLVFVFGLTVVAVIRLPSGATATDVIQAIDAGVNELVFLGIAVYFLSGLENRRKRTRALKALHRFRSMAHIIDLHQLHKDPDRIAHPDAGSDTPSSPPRDLTPFELSRYLDYCSEMLSILGKTAALYAQDFDDSVTLSAVNDIETLTTGLSSKIWQKIMILDRQLPNGG